MAESKPVRLTHHSRVRLDELERIYGLALPTSDLEQVIGQPDWSDPDTSIAAAVEKWYKGHPIRIVYVERQDFLLVITVMVISRGSHI